LEIATTYRRTVYDSLYVALAMYLDSEMITTDQRLVNALARTPLARHVRLLSTF
jgi:predicted nucleic acid-binding protein